MDEQLDKLQIGLDAAGVLDPTGAADLTNAGISGLRGRHLAAGISLASVVGLDALKAAKYGTRAMVGSLGKYEVGAYQILKEGAQAGLDAHHVGQKALMSQLIPGYDQLTAPSILLPKLGHTIRGADGVVSRSMTGFENARQVVARDIGELRRVYPDIPNSRLQQLIKMNKDMYHQIRR
jgi:hypothetical protein